MKTASQKKGAARIAAEEAAGTTVEPNAPTRGRIVDYTNAEGVTMAAIVTQVGPAAHDEAKGHSVTPMHVCGFDPVMGPRNYHLEDAGAACREECGEPGTWNWPTRVPEEAHDPEPEE